MNKEEHLLELTQCTVTMYAMFSEYIQQKEDIYEVSTEGEQRRLDELYKEATQWMFFKK